MQFLSLKIEAEGDGPSTSAKWRAGSGNGAVRAGHGGGGSPVLHGAQRRKGGDTAMIAKRGRVAVETVQPLRQGAGTGPDTIERRGGSAATFPPICLAYLAMGISLIRVVHDGLFRLRLVSKPFAP